MILRLLDIPHEIESISFEDLKKESFLSINPNGRMPAIQDPNNDDLVLWESGAVRIFDPSSHTSHANERADHRVPCRALRHQEQVELPCWIQGSCACKAVAVLPGMLGLHHIVMIRIYSQLHRYLDKVHTTVNQSGLSATTKRSFPAPLSVTSRKLLV